MLNKEEIRKQGYKFIDLWLDEDRNNAEWVRFQVEYFDSTHCWMGSRETPRMKMKMQPQIKVGDIYKNAAGDFVYIFKSNVLLDDFSGIFYGQVIGDIGKYRYDSRGVCAIGHDLCLDKKYEISEIENE